MKRCSWDNERGLILYFAHLEKRLRLRLLFAAFLVSISLVAITSGQSSPQNKDGSNKTDSELKSIARVNPSTRAMEFSFPMQSYPGRNSNGLSYGLTYSSKVWRMDEWFTWFYGLPYSCERQYVTYLKPLFGERSTSGWTSTISPPIIEEKVELYDEDGRPYDPALTEVGLNALFNDLVEEYDGILDGLMSAPHLPCGWTCRYFEVTCNGSECHISGCAGYDYNAYCDLNGPGPGPIEPSGCQQPTGNPEPIPLQNVKRLRVRTSDGATREFRASDSAPSCGNSQSICTPDMNGIYLSVDGSGMRLEKTPSGSILFLPDGSRYLFPGVNQQSGDEGEKLYIATEYLDSNGNRTTYSTLTNAGRVYTKTTDTLGRELTNPLPQNFGSASNAASAGEQIVSLPGFNGGSQDYQLTWKRLKPHGCEGIENDPSCGDGDGALENQAEKLYYDAQLHCFGSTQTTIPGTNEFLFPANGWGLRSCSSFRFEEDGNGNLTTTNDRFNPVVLTGITLPDGRKYEFKYNQWAEITKIVYPSGGVEKFEYGYVEPLSSLSVAAYNQTNRGVTKHWIYKSATDLAPNQYTEYESEITPYPNFSYESSVKKTKGNSTEQFGMRSESVLVPGDSEGMNFGFESPLTGMATEERVFDEYGELRSRSLREWATKSTQVGSFVASRDPRVKRTVNITVENGQALATLSETEYDETGSPDPEHFSHLNAKRKKSHHFRNIPLSLAQTGTLALITTYFNNATVATIGETDYLYDANYKERGIASMPIETRSLDPADNSVLAKTQTIYDNQTPAAATNYPAGYSVQTYGVGSSFGCSDDPQEPKVCWENPNSQYIGRPTTSRLWDSDNNVWIETHTRYDIFGNAIAARDAIGNETTTLFEDSVQAPYKYAYPTRVDTSGPDPTNTHGTSEGSFSTSTYDFMTGLPLTSTN